MIYQLRQKTQLVVLRNADQAKISDTDRQSVFRSIDNRKHLGLCKHAIS